MAFAISAASAGAASVATASITNALAQVAVAAVVGAATGAVVGGILFSVTGIGSFKDGVFVGGATGFAAGLAVGINASLNTIANDDKIIGEVVRTLLGGAQYVSQSLMGCMAVFILLLAIPSNQTKNINNDGPLPESQEGIRRKPEDGGPSCPQQRTLPSNRDGVPLPDELFQPNGGTAVG